jgi:hypothetical protein
MSNLKVSVLVIAGMLAFAPCVQAAAPNLLQNPRFLTATTDPTNYAADSWAYFNTATAATAIVTRLAPGLKMESVNSATAGFSTTDRGVWQAVPVIAGATYQVNAQWKGYLNTDGATGSTSRTSCNIYVAFGTAATGPWSNERTLWYKRLAYNRQIDSWNVPLSCFVPSSVGNYSFPDFESANTSPMTNQAPAGDVLLTVPAGMSYMRVRLGFTAEIQLANSGGGAWVTYDNVTVTGCQGALSGDTDADCDVDKYDLTNVANAWLSCGNSSNSVLCW